MALLKQTWAALAVLSWGSALIAGSCLPPVPPWMLRISRNVINDFARSRARVSRHRGQPFHDRGHVPTSVFSSFGVEPVDMETLAAQADIVSIHVPASSETADLIGSNFLGLMKATAVLINTGRGSTVNESALLHALDRNLISWAALDVFLNEPLSQNNQLLSLPNLSVTPHVASITSAFEPKRKIRIGEEIRAFLSGERPKNCVNWEALR